MGLLFLLLDRVFQIFSALILIRVLLSWARVFGLNQPIVRTLDRTVHQLTAPIIDPIRRVMPPAGGLDLSPLIALLLLQVVNQLLHTVLLGMLP
jgi:YggT family protein